MRRLIVLGVFVLIFANFTYYSWDEGSLYGVPEGGDGIDYDAIAFNVWKNQGFGFDWDNPEYYDAYRDTPYYSGVRVRHSPSGF